jgi:hypothetical protein
MRLGKTKRFYYYGKREVIESKLGAVQGLSYNVIYVLHFSEDSKVWRNDVN